MNDTKNVKVMDEFDAGIFVQKIDRAMRDAALGSVVTGKKGKVVVEMTFDRIGESSQVSVKHVLKYTVPKERGKLMEENTTSTPLHVLPGGVLSVAPERQVDMFKPETQAE